MLVYLAHPYGRRNGYSGDKIISNVEHSILVARQLITLGHIPFVPLLYHYVHAGWGDTPDEDGWHKICSTWLPKCDVVLVSCIDKVDVDVSKGLNQEIDQANALGIPVVYNIDNLRLCDNV